MICNQVRRWSPDIHCRQMKPYCKRRLGTQLFGMVDVNSNTDGIVDKIVAIGKTFVNPLRVILADGMMVGGSTSLEVGVVDRVGGILSEREMGEGLLFA